MDGVCAAWVAWLALAAKEADAGNSDYSKIEIVPHNHGQPFDVTTCAGRTVYILDYCFPLETMREIQNACARLVVLDHHATAQKDILALQPRAGDEFIFDMKKSGASLAWLYFNPGIRTPRLVDFCEDRDLWLFKDPHTEPIMDVVASYPYDVQAYDDIYWSLEHPKRYNDIVEQGRAIGRYKARQVEECVKNARSIELAGERVLAVNCTVLNLLSQCAGVLAKGRAFGVAYWRRGDGLWIYSLRSDDDGLDVSEIARAFGGGGHPHAAGFQSERLLGETASEGEAMRGKVREWAMLAYHEGDGRGDAIRREQLWADIDHSALLLRLLSGKKLLPKPPPRAFSYPWYALGEGSRCHYMELHEPKIYNGSSVSINQDGGYSWKDKDAGVLVYNRTGELFQVNLETKEIWKVSS